MKSTKNLNWKSLIKLRYGNARALRNLEELKCFPFIMSSQGGLWGSYSNAVAWGGGRGEGESCSQKSRQKQPWQYQSIHSPSACDCPVINFSAIPNNKGLPVPGFHWVKSWLSVMMSKQCSVSHDGLLVRVKNLPLSFLADQTQIWLLASGCSRGHEISL